MLFRSAGGILLSGLGPFARVAEAGRPRVSTLFWVTDIPNRPFRKRRLGADRHVGVECLIELMAREGTKLYRSRTRGPLAGRKGLIAADDVVLIKVNAQWKYRGCTNSDVVRGLIRRVLDHPDGFTGEVVLIDNGQGYGSFRCDNITNYPDRSVHANANKRTHSFAYLVDTVFDEIGRAHV